jgi:hypothetical protein
MMRFHFAIYCTSLDVQDYKQNKEDGMHNRSENGRGANVTLHVHHTYNHTHVQSDLFLKVK